MTYGVLLRIGILQISVTLASALFMACDEPADAPRSLQGAPAATAKPEPPDSAGSASQEALATDDPRRTYRRHQISRFEIDDPKYLPTSLAVGFKDFIGSKLPILSFRMPKDADYVEIMRCRDTANIATGTGTVPLGDVGLSPDAAEQMRTNDFFRAAEETSGCEVISLGEVSNLFQDSYAPTGSFLYLVRACIATQRLLDVDQLSKRHCSRQVAISSTLSYQNKRREQENQAMHKMAVYEAKIDQSFWNMRILAEDMIQEAVRCEDREANRMIRTKTKEAWITIAATAADVALELMSYGKSSPAKILTHYTVPIRNGKPGVGRVVDQFGMLAAMGGLSFRDMIINLATGSEDMPRSCARLQSLQLKMQAFIGTLNHDFYGVAYYAQAAEIASSGQDITDGQSLPPPNSGFDFGGF